MGIERPPDAGGIQRIRFLFPIFIGSLKYCFSIKRIAAVTAIVWTDRKAF